MTRLADTDAFILMEFRDAAKPLMHRPLTEELKLAVGKVALPFHKRLMEAGNSARESASLLQMVYEDKQYA